MKENNRPIEPVIYFGKIISSIFKIRPLAVFSIGVIIGFILAILFGLELRESVSDIRYLLIGAFIGVFAEIFVNSLEMVWQKRKLVEPLNRVLGTLAVDDTWIYISAWRRDLSDLDHSRVYRNDPGKKDQPTIYGTQFVYGKGDAVALSYVYQVLEKSGSSDRQITVEDNDSIVDCWGRSAICIGAHNSKTREILEKFNNPFFKFFGNYNVIVNVNDKPLVNDQGVAFYKGVAQKSATDSIDIDYGIILKLKDEYHPEKNIIVIAGLGDCGTAGAAYYLLTHVENLPFTEETFGVLIEVPSGIESARMVEFDDVAKNHFTQGRRVE